MSTSVSPGRAPASVAAEPSSLGLRKRSLPFREVFAQSLAGTGPSGSLAFGPALVFASAGHGTWISYAVFCLKKKKTKLDGYSHISCQHSASVDQANIEVVGRLAARASELAELRPVYAQYSVDAHTL